MNKTILSITAAVALLFASCGNNTKNTDSETTDAKTLENTQEAAAPKSDASIVGVWKMSDMQVDMEIPKGKEQAFDEMKKKMVEATVYTFNEDGTMSFKNHLVKETTGTYTYENGKVTMYSNTTKKSDIATVDELTADKLVLSSEQGGKKAVMIFSK